ncbi:MAG: lipoyl synthase [Candidatus Omnitrophica bacterium]|nr:lipoyl synthase [Candidatus Omnitrophota bacterium]
MAVENGTLRKPRWLNKRIDFKKCQYLTILLKNLNLNTICQEARCPNISECFSEGVASFLILGRICSRNCRFCAVGKGIAQGVDLDEPQRVAKAAKILGLKHIVLTSVTRDDLTDGGAGIFADSIDKMRKANKDIVVEVLVPDFKGSVKLVRKVMDAKPDIFAHNLETVPRLYAEVRKDSDYLRSLSVLESAKRLNKKIYTKSAIMLGLGESEQEVFQLFSDLRRVKCDFLSIGQYLAPSLKHFRVKEYVQPEKFVYYKHKAQELGFLHIESGPYVRSSYLAHRYIQKFSSS